MVARGSDSRRSADSVVVIAYLEGIVHLLLGNNTAHVICTANANQLALTMRLNEESVSLGYQSILFHTIG
jgi:hypothetical protein